MRFDNTFYISDLLGILTLITILVGGLFALYKWNKSMRIKRADYIKSLIDINNKEMILETFSLFDYDIKWYDNSFHGSEKEQKIDFTLTYFDYICYLNKMGLFDKKTFLLFKYQVDAIVKNRQVHDYFYNLYHYSKSKGIEFSYHYLIEYAIKHDCINKELFDKTSYRKYKMYHKYLNWID